MLALNFSPFPELKTGRLLLRKLERTDAAEMFFLRSNENVLRYLESTNPPNSFLRVILIIVHLSKCFL